MFRSILFTPADRPERVAKAVASGADLICIDLEDSIAPGHKAAARITLEQVLAKQTDPAQIFVRVNPLDSLDGVDDLRALIRTRVRIRGIMLPKVNDARDPALVAAWLAEADLDWRLIALIEDAKGLAEAASIAAAPRVDALALGAIDLAASLGAVLEGAALDVIRLKLRLAASQAGVLALDAPDLDFLDLMPVTHAAQRSCSLGYDGKLAIHPAQIPPINAAFTPTPEALDRANRIVSAAAASGSGVTVVDGKMVDRPIIEAAHRILERARSLTRI